MKKSNMEFNFKMARRILALVIIDILVVVACAFMALFIGLDFNAQLVLESEYTAEILRWLWMDILLTVGTFTLLKLYNSLWIFAGEDELIHIMCATAIVTVVKLAQSEIIGSPTRFPVISGMMLFLCTTLVRFAYRFVRRIKTRLIHTDRARTMLIGAGQAGALMLREFGNSRFSHNNVVCIIDDDPMKKGRRLMGVKVVGNRDNIVQMVDEYDVSEIILAIPSISNKAKKEIWEICTHTGCKLKQLPGVYQLANGDVTIQSIRDVQIEDLLERDVVRVDDTGLSDMIRDKTVMVTGGGGSIGSELCRQLASYHPSKLIIFDIYENNAYAIEQELRRNYPALCLHVLVGSVRDAARVESVMEQFRPAVVFHAAAHKHIPLMETSPMEAVKNNVFGTLNTARAADKYGVEHFVLISTDKAVNPTNVMGASKRICEMIIQSFADKSETCFAAVRFGNVLGSNGSVIPLFREQIKKGGPVTVTDPEITRFFMTIPEAVSLVLQAGAFAQGGEIFVLDMGSPVRIDDLARNMIRLSGFEPDVDIQVIYTGLRPGEKLYEELLMSEEGLTKTANDLIYIGHKTDFDQALLYESLEKMKTLTEGQDTLLRQRLMELVPTYKPSEEAVCV